MLLHHLVLFLNFFVAASVELVELELGWNRESRHGPQIGGTYMMLIPRDYAVGVVSHDGSYEPFIVIHQVANSNQYHVVRIGQLEAHGARPAMDFFGYNALGRKAQKVLRTFYIFPGDWYEVEGTPEIMRRWKGYTTVMSKVGVEQLRAASAGFVDGWDKEGKVKLGVIYWTLPRYLGITGVADFIPCVALDVIDNNKVRVVRMHPSEAHGARHAADFFKIDGKLQSAKLQTYFGTIDFTTFYIFPREVYEVNADPGIMQTWNGHITQMPKEGREKLMAASLGLVDGWNPGAEPQVGGVYWIDRRNLEIRDFVVSPIPCVLTDRCGDRCPVVCLFRRIMQGAKRATYFFGNDAELQTHTGSKKIDLHGYYLVPGRIYEVKANPSIMRLWEGYFTKISQEGLEKIKLTAKASTSGRGVFQLNVGRDMLY